MNSPAAPLEPVEARITMADGVELAATLYLPDEGLGPQPALLEALPYRKDDLTSSYSSSYVRLRDEFGYAVCRVDLRGTGSSGGDAHDEYPSVEQTDLATVIAWLAEQPWCNGNVGMWGTSYSGFNSLQLACERPPALKAVCAIYSSDDRWTDDVHWRGGALRMVDLVDYCHYMTPMTALPPVPAVWGEGWREEWLRRIEITEPWVFRWLREDRHGDYWRQGSLRLDQDGRGYDRIDCAVMIVAGWADGYRNNSFRTVEALRKAGVPHRLLAGPWAHASPKTAMPGPRIDLTVEMVAWWDRWLRGRDEGGHRDGVDVFVRTSSRPEPDLDTHEGYWIRDRWPSAASTTATFPLPWPDGGRSLAVRADVGTAAWIDCAGHLPWGLSTDQRHDDADSLTWELAPPAEAFVGHPRLLLRVAADAPAASLSVKLNDVFPDGTSALVARGSLDLTFRDGVHGTPAPLTPGEVYDVEVDLDACAYRLDPGHRLRVAVAGADWPNTAAPPAPVTLTVHAAELVLPLHAGSDEPAPTFVPGHATSAEDADGITWSVTRDVLQRTTTCAVGSVDRYDVPHDGKVLEDYSGTVTVDRRSFRQQARAATTYELTWPGVPTIRVRSTMDLRLRGEAIDVRVDLEVTEGDQPLTTRSWQETFRHGC
ncbi:MAG: CocE/NonD family hydrolase [Nocardioides sp.]